MTQIPQIQQRSRSRPKAGLETETERPENESFTDRHMDSFVRPLHSVCGASRRPRTLRIWIAAGESEHAF